jgi:hypothetical protein
MAINMNAPGPWNNFNPVANNVPLINKPFPTFDKPSPAPGTTISYNPPVGPVGDVPLTTRPFPDLQGPKPNPTSNLSFTFGGGGGGGGGASVPSNVLTPQQFSPYESTYVPPTPATPDPYNWATRDPYIYGEGLSNAGAAYDIWGSAPGTNPYLMTVPSDYTPGLLGMQPVQLPDNVPSTNIGANLNFGRDDTTTTTPRISLGYNDRKDYVGFDDSYTGAKHGARNMGVGKQSLYGQGTLAAGGNPYPVGHPLNQGSAGAAAAKLAAQAKMKAYEDVTMGSRIDALAKPVTSFKAKKEKARVSVAAYNKTPTGKKFSIDMSPKAGTYGGRPRL